MGPWVKRLIAASEAIAEALVRQIGGAPDHEPKPRSTVSPGKPGPRPGKPAAKPRRRTAGGAHGLIDRLAALHRGEQPPPMPGNRPMLYRQQTANTRAMRIALEYAREGGDPGAREAALDWYEVQQRDGHCCWGRKIEQSCCDPHWNYHFASSATIYLTALYRSDVRVQGAAMRWIRGELAILRLCSIAGAVAYPGTRGKTAIPLWDVATAVLAAAEVRHPKESHTDPWWLSVGLMGRIRHRMPQIVDWHFEPPALRMPLTVHRWTDGYQAQIAPPDPPAGWIAHPVDWVRVETGRHSRGSRVPPITTWGRGWQTPPPEPPPGAARYEVGRR